MLQFRYYNCLSILSYTYFHALGWAIVEVVWRAEDVAGEPDGGGQGGVQGGLQLRQQAHPLHQLQEQEQGAAQQVL